MKLDTVEELAKALVEDMDFAFHAHPADRKGLKTCF
jgi:hypothetical protein